jgi:hypothetical protein
VWRVVIIDSYGGTFQTNGLPAHNRRQDWPGGDPGYWLPATGC